MNRYTNAEFADIHFIYGIENRTGYVAVWLYGGKYTMRVGNQNIKKFALVHQNLETFRLMIDDTPGNCEMGLVAGVSIASATIRKMPGIFEHVPQSMSRWCRVCIHANASNFKHLLW
ncbi:hypothetical protein TNCV_2249811 [Trichonephila clavipes]|nr:hypothetical protein TNCV_2249811 [Trichonephila clavipes]